MKQDYMNTKGELFRQGPTRVWREKVEEGYRGEYNQSILYIQMKRK
jgi:hypothetical protein